MKIFCLTVLCVCSSLISAPCAEETGSEVQRARANWVLGDLAWLVSWQHRQLSRLPTNHEVLLLLAEGQPKASNPEFPIRTWAIVRPSGLGVWERGGTKLIRIVDGEYRVEVAEIDISGKIAKELVSRVWSWAAEAPTNSQIDRIVPGENELVLIFVAEPYPNGRVGGMQMIESINPPRGGKVRSFQRDLETLLDTKANTAQEPQSGR
jgi:hypothetical protein